MSQDGPFRVVGKDTNRAACTKCGYAGHLTYQCRNFLKIDPNKDIVLDVSSTSSESDDLTTPLTSLHAAEIAQKLHEKNLAKKKKHRKRSYSASSSDESDSSSEKRKRKKKKKKVKKKKSAKRKRKHSSSSSS